MIAIGLGGDLSVMAAFLVYGLCLITLGLTLVSFAGFWRILRAQHNQLLVGSAIVVVAYFSLASAMLVSLANSTDL
jgi:inner membrane protein involved in colicin E2 resistance